VNVRSPLARDLDHPREQSQWVSTVDTTLSFLEEEVKKSSYLNGFESGPDFGIRFLPRNVDILAHCTGQKKRILGNYCDTFAEALTGYVHNINSVDLWID
jgi:hypothetical protein